MGEHGRLHAGAAHLVDGRRACGNGYSGFDRSLTRRSLPLTGGQNAAHIDVFDRFRCKSRSCKCATNGRGTEVCSLSAGKIALKAAHGSTGSTDNDNGIAVGHDRSSLVFSVRNSGRKTGFHFSWNGFILLPCEVHHPGG